MNNYDFTRKDINARIKVTMYLLAVICLGIQGLIIIT